MLLMKQALLKFFLTSALLNTRPINIVFHMCSSEIGSTKLFSSMYTTSATTIITFITTKLYNYTKNTQVLYTNYLKKTKDNTTKQK